MIESEGEEADEVSVVLGDDALLRELNDTYRGKPRPTDVLSFPLGRCRPLPRVG